MLSTFVKASGITHLTDARYFAAWETEWLGFTLSPGTENSVDLRQVAALREWVDGVKICGEFNLATEEEINSAIELLQLETVQLGMLTPLATLKGLSGVEIIQEIVVESYIHTDELAAIMEERDQYADYLLLNFSKGGIIWSDLQAGVPFSQTILKHWAEKYKLLLDLSLTGTSPSTFLREIPAAGFNVQGGEEEKVGYKSFDELDEFFEDLEVLV